ncbi:MAG: phage tail protein [Phycisphaeraceae bacterium]|nr:phage tail protein [Phycisphaeraceae bacterium]
MSDPFVGEIRMFAGNFAPRSWAFCDGQLLSINQNDALFSLLGTIYGGDGRTTFGLPDLRGRVPIHQGSGAGLTPRQIGSRSGQETVTLGQNQLPSHTHPWQAANIAATSTQPVGNAPAIAQGDVYTSDITALNMSGSAIANAGGSQPHVNMMPFLAIHFIIALVGIYPSR